MFASVTPERFKGAVGAGVTVPAILYLLIAGLVVHLPGLSTPKSDLFTLTQPPPPPEVKVELHPKPNQKAEGEAAPPNIKSQATDITAPPVPPPPVPPPPIAAAAKPFDGLQSTQGAAPFAGPGTGAGGIGDGTGSGGDGDGDGGGYREVPPRFVKGKLKSSDIPESAWEAGIQGRVGLRYFVNVDGSVSGCQVTRSSGSALLDSTTCRLIEQRYRYRPSLDGDGRPVRSVIVESHTWVNPLNDDRDDR